MSKNTKVFGLSKHQLSAELHKKIIDVAKNNRENRDEVCEKIAELLLDIAAKALKTETTLKAKIIKSLGLNKNTVICIGNDLSVYSKPEFVLDNEELNSRLMSASIKSAICKLLLYMLAEANETLNQDEIAIQTIIANIEQNDGAKKIKLCRVDSQLVEASDETQVMPSETVQA